MSVRRKGEGWARVPGSCGELVQGCIQGHLAHVTFPVGLYGSVHVHRGDGLGIKLEPKLQQAVQLAASSQNPHCGQRVQVVRRVNPLPAGRGMASSTVDICAGIVAVGAALGRRFSVQEIAHLAVRIEPTDGVFVPGVALCSHQDGAVCETLAWSLPVDVVVLDSGLAVDTVEFNGRKDLPLLNRQKEAAVERAFEQVAQGLVSGDTVQVGRGATGSALANQRILPKPFLEEIVDLVQWYGGIGVTVAHSGSVIGLMFEQDSSSQNDAARDVMRRFPVYTWVAKTNMVSGGVQWAGW